LFGDFGVPPLYGSEKIRNDPSLADRIKELRKTEKKSQSSAHAVSGVLDQ
jgi:hypothetical protein